MIHTITINTAVDKVIHIEDTLTRKHNNITKYYSWDVGGKATHVAMALNKLGHQVVATGFVGGDTGEKMISLMESEGVNCQFINQADSETRTSTILVDESNQGSYMITEEGFEISETSFQKLEAYLNENVEKDDIVVFAGSPPKNFAQDWYRHLLDLSQKNGGRLVVDVSKEYLDLALEFNPYLVKPNEFEFSQMVDKNLETVEDYAQALGELETEIEYFIVSLGKRGSLLKVDDHTILHCIAPDIIEKNETGAGDHYVAGLVSAIDDALSSEEMLVLASAVGASKAMQEGSSGFNLEDLDELKKNCKFERIIV